MNKNDGQNFTFSRVLYFGLKMNFNMKCNILKTNNYYKNYLKIISI